MIKTDNESAIESEKGQMCDSCRDSLVSPEAAANGYPYCDNCSIATSCSRCDRNADGRLRIWENPLCERCQKVEDLHDWKVSIVKTLAQAAAANGWEMTEVDFETLATGSDYIEFWHGSESREEPIEPDQYLEIRISDHAICSPVMRTDPDYSIEYEVSETSHGLDQVLRRLRKGAVHAARIS